MLQFLFASQVAAEDLKNWTLSQTLKPPIDHWGIYGRTVAVSSTTPRRLVVAASWDNFKEIEGTDVDARTSIAPGNLYVYEYDSINKSWILMPNMPISATDDDNTHIYNLGSTAVISNDGNRIVAGAPYSDVKDDSGNYINEVGAVVVFDYDKDSKKWKQQAVLYKHNPKKNPKDGSTDYDEGQGLGRSLTATPDCKIIASAYYNKPGFLAKDQGVVFVTKQKADDTWTDLTAIYPASVYQGIDTTGKYFKFGADLHFQDASHLIIGTYIWQGKDKNNNNAPIAFEKDFGTVIMINSNDEWKVDKIIPVPQAPEGKTFSFYGTPVSMPLTSQKILGISGGFTDNNNSFYVYENSGSEWKTAQIIENAGDESWQSAGFCNDSVFYTLQSNRPRYDGNPGTLAFMTMFRKDSNGKYVQAEEFEGKSYSADERNNFGSAITWTTDCQSLIVGSMSKNMTGPKNKTHTPWGGSETLVYSIKTNDGDDKQDSGLTKPQKIGIGVGVALAVIIIVVIVVVIILLRNNKKKGNKESGSGANV